MDSHFLLSKTEGKSHVFFLFFGPVPSIPKSGGFLDKLAGSKRRRLSSIKNQFNLYIHLGLQH